MLLANDYSWLWSSVFSSLCMLSINSTSLSLNVLNSGQFTSPSQDMHLWVIQPPVDLKMNFSSGNLQNTHTVMHRVTLNCDAQRLYNHVMICRLCCAKIQMRAGCSGLEPRHVWNVAWRSDTAALVDLDLLSAWVMREREREAAEEEIQPVTKMTAAEGGRREGGRRMERECWWPEAVRIIRNLHLCPDTYYILYNMFRM